MTWEELKQKAKEIGANAIYSDLIVLDAKCFWVDGDIDWNDDTFATNRTPDQMWQIMEALK